jgi:hypothetical protein
LAKNFSLSVAILNKPPVLMYLKGETHPFEALYPIMGAGGCQSRKHRSRLAAVPPELGLL